MNEVGRSMLINDPFGKTYCGGLVDWLPPGMGLRPPIPPSRTPLATCRAWLPSLVEERERALKIQGLHLPPPWRLARIWGLSRPLPAFHGFPLGS